MSPVTRPEDSTDSDPAAATADTGQHRPHRRVKSSDGVIVALHDLDGSESRAGDAADGAKSPGTAADVVHGANDPAHTVGGTHGDGIDAKRADLADLTHGPAAVGVGTGPDGAARATVLFCHPTGFHGMVWAPVAAQLADVAHCWALDFRGHGDSETPAPASLGWNHMADDVLAVIDELGAERLYGVGHSMGGAALILTELARPGTWEGLWLYEPIIFPPFEGPRPSGHPMAEAARRRKALFPNRETALFNYASKPPLGALHPDALEAYVSYGFRDLPDGTVELKCTPETEAKVFENGMGLDAFRHLDRVACPVTVCASGDGAPPAMVGPLVAEALPHGHSERFLQLSHFGPMEDPGAIAASIRPMLTTT